MKSLAEPFPLTGQTAPPLKFAIIIPVFNTEKYLRECLDSLICQTYKNFVAFVVDDGSTDGSGLIADNYCAYDSRFFVLHKRNGGVSSARNFALNYITNNKNCFDYVLFLDSDDLLDPECLEEVCRNINGERKIVMFGVERFDKDGRVQDSTKKDHLPKNLDQQESLSFVFDDSNEEYRSSPACSLFMSNLAVPVCLIKELRFDPNMKICEDQQFKMLVLARCQGTRIISKPLLKYRLRKGSLSHPEVINLLTFRYFMKLIDSAATTSEIVLKATERRAANAWWNNLRMAACTGVLKKEWREFADSLEMMRKNFHTDVLESNKFKKRVKIFLLGRIFVSFYFRLQARQPENTTLTYFD